MKKKRAIRNYAILAILLLVCLIFSFISFRIPTTVDNFAGFINGIYRGIDFNGGITATYVVEHSETFDGDMSVAVDKAVFRVESLLSDEFTEYYVEKVDEDKIRITIPNLSDATTIETKDIVNYIAFTTEEVSDPETYTATFTGANITNAQYYTANGAFGTLIEFDDEGKEALLDMASSVGDSGTLYIYQNKDFSSVLLRISVDSDSLTTIAQNKQLFVSDVSLFPTKGDAQVFADKIASGMLQIDMTIDGDISEVSPVYGEVFTIGALLIMIAFIIASIIYLVIKYGQMAIATALSLLSFVVLSIIIMPLITSVQMSVVGLVAMIIAYLITFIAHINYLEKARQEFESGKKFVASFKSAYTKSVVANADIFAIVLIVGIIGALVCAGTIKTASIVLSVLVIPGALASMLIHRGLVKWYLDINPTKYKKINFEKGVTENEK